jgi:aspartate oxidase
MELVQWYPTALAEPGEPAYLVHYDALLQQGAILRTAAGHDVLAGVDRDPERGITRDEMARHIAQAQVAHPLADWRIFIDVTHCRSLDDHPVLQASPYAHLLRERSGRPGRGLWVSPAAHYYMGGVAVDASGATEVPGLFAAGEVAGGCFGANRLEGNALMDCVVGGNEAGRQALAWAGLVDGGLHRDRRRVGCVASGVAAGA